MAKQAREKSGIQPDGTIKFVSASLGTIVGPGYTFGIKCQIDKLESDYGPEKAGYSEGVAYQKATMESWLLRSSWGQDHKVEDIDLLHPDDVDAICDLLTRYFNPRLWEQLQEIERKMAEMSAEGNP